MSKQDHKNIIWLASYPKSGNTWFRIFLDNILNSSSSSRNINQLSNSGAASSRTLIDNYSGVSSANLTQQEIEELRPEVYKSLAEHSKNPIFLKVHDAWKKTSSGKTMFPIDVTKGVIYIIRNPLDIAVSFSYHSAKDIDTTIQNINSKGFEFCSNPTRISQQVTQLLSDWSSHIVSWLDESGLPIIVIRYEDMLKDPISTFHEALNFLAINVEEKVFQRAVNASNFNVLRETEAKVGFIEKPIKMNKFFREGKSGNWKKHLNVSQQNEIVNSHYIQMQRFGYFPFS